MLTPTQRHLSMAFVITTIFVNPVAGAGQDPTSYLRISLEPRPAAHGTRGDRYEVFGPLSTIGLTLTLENDSPDAIAVPSEFADGFEISVKSQSRAIPATVSWDAVQVGM